MGEDIQRRLVSVGEITRKFGFMNQKIHKFTLSSGFSGLNNKKKPSKNQCLSIHGLNL